MNRGVLAAHEALRADKDGAACPPVQVLGSTPHSSRPLQCLDIFSGARLAPNVKFVRVAGAGCPALATGLHGFLLGGLVLALRRRHRVAPGDPLVGRHGRRASAADACPLAKEQVEQKHLLLNLPEPRYRVFKLVGRRIGVWRGVEQAGARVALVGWVGCLLVLGHECLGAHAQHHIAEPGQILASRVQGLAGPSPQAPAVILVLHGDRRQINMLPAALVEQVRGQVVMGQPLHDHDDHPLVLVIETLVDVAVVPAANRAALLRVVRVVGRLGVVDDDHVGPEAGERVRRRERRAEPALGEPEAAGRFAHAGVREQRTVPGMLHQPPGQIVLLLGECPVPGDAHDLRLRPDTKHPGREGHRGADRLERSLGRVDDEPLALAFVATRQRLAQHIDRPVVQVRHARVQQPERQREEHPRLGPVHVPDGPGLRISHGWSPLARRRHRRV